MHPLRNTLLATIIVAVSLAVAPAGALAVSQPSVESESVSNVTQSGATLEAQIAPGATAAYYQFEVVSDPNEYRSEIACPLRSELRDTDGCQGPEVEGVTIGYIAAGSGAKSVSLDLADTHTTLTAGTTYHYRVLAATKIQTEDTLQWETPPVYGPDQTFTTLPEGVSAPSIKGVSASSITDTNARLEAQINPEGLDTSYEFYLEYPSCFSGGPGFCEASGGKEIASGTIPADSSTQTVSEDVAAVLGHSLLPDSTYGYRVVASNAAGTSYSGLHAFTTLPGTAPVIESVSVSHLTRTDATLEATIDTEGLPTSYEFTMLNSPCSKKGAGCDLIREIPLPSGGRLYGSFAPQTVSLDLNAAGVTLGEGEYDFSVRATNAAGSTSAGGGVFEAPEPVVTPQTQQGGGTPPSSDSNQPGTSSTTSTGSGSSSSTPGGTPRGAPLGKTTKLKARKLAKAIEACKKYKPMSKRTACEKQARKQYGAATKYGVVIKTAR